MTTEATTTAADERTDLLAALAQHRYLFRVTVDGLTDEQAAAQPTVSSLCLGGLVKHVAAVERRWMEFVLRGAAAFPAMDDPAVMGDYEQGFRMLPGETLAGILADYDEVARRTAEIVAGLNDLGVSHALPEAPWFEPGARWSARRVLVHVIAETAQHAGHADILRESIDGHTTMA